MNTNAITTVGTDLFAGTSEGCFLSTNDGTNWIVVDSGLTNASISAFAVINSNIFAGTQGGGVFLSTNKGGNWAIIDSGLTNTYVNTLAVSGKNIFAGTEGGGVFLSTNNGANWTAVNEGLWNLFIKSLASVSSNIFAALEYGGILRSTNNGASWTEADSGLSDTWACFPLEAVGPDLFSAVNGYGVFLSTNNGTSWTAVNTGLPPFPSIYAFTVSGINLFAGTSDGIWKRSLSEMIAPNIHTFQFTSGWKMISVPLVVADNKKTLLRRTAALILCTFISDLRANVRFLPDCGYESDVSRGITTAISKRNTNGAGASKDSWYLPHKCCQIGFAQRKNQPERSDRLYSLVRI